MPMWNAFGPEDDAPELSPAWGTLDEGDGACCFAQPAISASEAAASRAKCGAAVARARGGEAIST
jgi:hypothetical protein